jgi:hypothetical protein
MSEYAIPLPQARAVRTRSLFTVGMGILMLVVVVAGFWPPYYGPLLRGDPLEPFMQFWGIQLHAAFCLAWLVCFLVQAVLVQRARTHLHRRAGWVMAVFAVMVTVVGAWCGFAIAFKKMETGMSLDDAAGFLFIPLSDMVMFAGFLAAAIACRRRVELHSRLMLLATLTLAIVGSGRLVFIIFPKLFDQNIWLFGVVWLTPLWLAMGYDLLTRRRVHFVHFIGLVLFAPRAKLEPLMESEGWRWIGRALLRPFL